MSLRLESLSEHSFKLGFVPRALGLVPRALGLVPLDLRISFDDTGFVFGRRPNLGDV